MPLTAPGAQRNSTLPPAAGQAAAGKTSTDAHWIAVNTGCGQEGKVAPMMGIFISCDSKLRCPTNLGICVIPAISGRSVMNDTQAESARPQMVGDIHVCHSSANSANVGVRFGL